ncbi:MAG: hypothetical protein LH616_18975 [Ilumatobacteraceae bacterium]|nr:hypothetical protein [Ilumatobacteraceae bacterium]
MADNPAYPETLDRNDRGKGSLSDYRGVLEPANARVTIRLAASDLHQAELAGILALGGQDLETAMTRRSLDQERVDAPIEVRLFTGTRVSGPVGWVPRGLESVIDETLARLDVRGKKQRISVAVVKKGGKYRVDLLIGLTR